jgi:hypothetical protein
MTMPIRAPTAEPGHRPYWPTRLAAGETCARCRSRRREVRYVGIFVGILALVLAVALLARLLLRVRASRRS